MQKIPNVKMNFTFVVAGPKHYLCSKGGATKKSAWGAMQRIATNFKQSDKIFRQNRTAWKFVIINGVLVHTHFGNIDIAVAEQWC
jgi:hypothetical protein